MSRIRDFVFRLYEQQRVRNWFYTAAFLVFVPVGYRFAALAWQYGDWFDKPLAVVAGLLIGITAVVTLMRFWHVPPRQVITASERSEPLVPVAVHAGTDDLLNIARRRAAENRAMAQGASALGSTRRRGW